MRVKEKLIVTMLLLIRRVKMIFLLQILFCIILQTNENLEQSQEEAGCLYRDYPVRMPPHIFSLWGCWGCYDYLNRYLPDMEVEVNFNCRKDKYKIPCHNATMYFDRHDEYMVNAIAATLLSEWDKGKWLRCCEASDICCEQIKETETEVSNFTCPALWDGWECWEATLPNTTPHGSCAEYIYSGSEPSCDLYCSKHCDENATWLVQTDYTTCSHAPRLRLRHHYHVYILGSAIALSLPALFIFVGYKRLRNLTRVILHRNLLIAIIIRNTLVILLKHYVIIDELYSTVQDPSNMIENSAWCRTLTTLEKFSSNMVFACMALESVYLHRVLARSFKGQPNMVPYYISSTVICAIFVLVWAIIMATTQNDLFCWTVDWYELGTHWINDSLRITLLLINLVLLLDIVRVLLTRLREVHSAHASRIRRTAKATLLLAPIFGVQFLATAIKPTTRNCTTEQAYYMSIYFIEAIQGPLVATLYCYTNKEVRLLLSYTWEKRFVHSRPRKPRVSAITDITELPTSGSVQYRRESTC